jgi:hypothetical protein
MLGSRIATFLVQMTITTDTLVDRTIEVGPSFPLVYEFDGQSIRAF